MFDDEDKDLSRGFNGNQENRSLPEISTDDINKETTINIDSSFSTPDQPLNEKANEEESTTLTSATAVVPGTPAARATN